VTTTDKRIEDIVQSARRADPCGFAKDGLPIGLQIVGPPWGEESVLRLAHALEQATDWHTRRPAL